MEKAGDASSAPRSAFVAFVVAAAAAAVGTDETAALDEGARRRHDRVQPSGDRGAPSGVAYVARHAGGVDSTGGQPRMVAAHCAWPAHGFDDRHEDNRHLPDTRSVVDVVVR